jgi:hypothetical protein
MYYLIKKNNNKGISQNVCLELNINKHAKNAVF